MTRSPGGLSSGAASRLLTAGTEVCKVVASALVLAVPVMVTVSVLSRSVLDRPISLLFELTEFAMLFVTFLAVPYVGKRNEHVRVEILGQTPGSMLYRATQILSALMGFIICAVLGIASLYFTVESFGTGATMATRAMPPRWTVVFVIPLGLLLLAAWQLRDLIAALRDPSSAQEKSDDPLYN